MERLLHSLPTRRFRPRRLFTAVAMLVVLASLSAATPEVRTFDLERLTPADVFTAERGFGFDLGTVPSSDGSTPFYFSLAVPEGNHRVTITFGHSRAGSDTTLKAESRQLLLERLVTPAGEFETRSFVVNVRTPRLPPPEKNAPGGDAALLNPREQGLLRWDEKLTLEFNGPAPRVRRIVVEPAEVPTIFLAGDSTVTDQPHEPAASWGQMLPRFLSSTIAVANHAESGETLKSFLSGLRLAKILSQLKPGDYLFIQFGHNDQKRQWPQTFADARTTYRAYLRAYIAEARLRGATPVLITSMQRRNFDDHGRIRNTLGDYPEAMRLVATEENVPLIDLERMSIALYEALGPEQAPRLFNDNGRDPTHHNNYGAYELAKCVAVALRQFSLPLSAHLSADVATFDPTAPDSAEQFHLPASPTQNLAELIRGN